MTFDIADRVADTYEKWSEASIRWSQVLAVGNGGGAVLVGGLLKDAKGVWWLVALPSAWMFVVGLLAAGATFFLGSREMLARHQALQVLHWHNELFPEQDSLGKADAEKYQGHQDDAGDAEKGRKLCEAASAIAFTVAVFWPVIVLTSQPLWSR
jgi:hypothetical protein